MVVLLFILTYLLLQIVRNKQLPEWVWPPLDANGTVPEIHVMENVSDRVVICTLNATGAVVYSIKSLKTGNIKGTFGIL